MVTGIDSRPQTSIIITKANLGRMKINAVFINNTPLQQFAQVSPSHRHKSPFTLITSF